MKIFNSEENMKKWVYFAMVVLININTGGGKCLNIYNCICLLWILSVHLHMSRSCIKYIKYLTENIILRTLMTSV